jgi:hypothetical protein
MSNVLLNAVANCKTERQFEQIVDFAKDTMVTEEAVEQAIENAKKLGFKVGSEVMMLGDPDKELGEVVRFNTSTIGFGTGDRYPVIVKFERGTFEYSVESLILFESKPDKTEWFIKGDVMNPIIKRIFIVLVIMSLPYIYITIDKGLPWYNSLVPFAMAGMCVLIGVGVVFFLLLSCSIIVFIEKGWRGVIEEFF